MISLDKSQFWVIVRKKKKKKVSVACQDLVITVVSKQIIKIKN